jgi:predicted  nucleic acid-binding Zn-ribbon protein
MIESDSKLIEQFEGKIRKLVDLYDTVKCTNSDLRSQLEAKDEEIRHLNQQLSEMKESYQNLKRSKVLEVSGHDIDDTKRRVSGLVREIDHCIKLLNV